MINSIILAVSISTLVFGFFGFIIYRERRESEIENERFREFVRAVKSKNLEEYEQSLPSIKELPKVIPDELIEMDQVDPATLLSAEKE